MGGSTKKFRRLLLERCQAEFERDHSQTIAELESLDEEARERKLSKIRKQYIGHMFFIGALYKQGLLKENIMHHCVQELFGDPSEPDSEKLECLAKLLTSIGKKLDAAALDKKEEAKTIQEIHDDIQAEEDKKAGRKPTRVKRDRSANNLTIISDDGWETVPTTTASVRRSSSRKERSQSPATVPSDVSMGGFGALLGGDKKKRDKDKKKKKKSRSKDSLTDLEEVSSTPFDEAKYRGKCKAAVAEYFSIEVVDEVVACAREELASLGEPSRLSLLASAALDVVLDGKQKDRERVPQLLLALSEKDVLTPAHFSTAFLEALAILPDITIDAPKAPQWLGDVLKALVEQEACSLAFLEGGAPAALIELGDEGTACWAKFKDYVSS